MNLRNKLLLSVAFLMASGQHVFANGSSDSATATVDAEILESIEVAVPAGGNMDFGSFTVGSGGGTVTANGNNTTAGGDVHVINAGKGGTFEVSGEPNMAYSFTLPASATISNNGSNPMTVALSFSAGTASRTLPGSGPDSVGVRGVLTVPSSHPAGSYSGTYNVQVDY